MASLCQYHLVGPSDSDGDFLCKNPRSAELNEGFTIDPNGDRISPLNVY